MTEAPTNRDTIERGFCAFRKRENIERFDRERERERVRVCVSADTRLRSRTKVCC